MSGLDLTAAPGDVAIELADDFDAINEAFYDRGWTDGLPIVPPTLERVEAMLRYCDRPSNVVLGQVAPRYGAATPMRVAANAVMAGCRPEYFPVLLAAVEALVAPEFNLYALQTTTHQCAVLTIVNGPIGREIGLNSRHNVFGPGWRANATIGRAVRFVLLNIGGGRPGESDMATIGQPGKFTYCIAENEDANPWEPLHVERGFDRDVTTVTLIGAEGPHNVNDPESRSAQGLLTTIAGTMSVTGANHVYFAGEPLVVLCPEHAATIAREGLSKSDVKVFLHERARIALERFSTENVERQMRVKWPELFEGTADGVRIPLARRPEDYVVVVAGGVGKHSAFIPTFGATRSPTRAIRLSNGSCARSVAEFAARG
ncbi:MAG TPA: hypothetical protein VMS64_23125 [Candidatus Methylomirabilis sp.]|nr:hypothetical protein [Candidatus Methylomirabilis sp.]